jgi:hypothetical protein
MCDVKRGWDSGEEDGWVLSERKFRTWLGENSTIQIENGCSLMKFLVEWYFNYAGMVLVTFRFSGIRGGRVPSEFMLILLQLITASLLASQLQTFRCFDYSISFRSLLVILQSRPHTFRRHFENLLCLESKKFSKTLATPKKMKTA